MPPKKKFRRGRGKKRKFTGNMYTRRKELELKEASEDQESVKRGDKVDSDKTDTSRSNSNMSENTSSFALLGKVQGLSIKKSKSESRSSDVDAAKMEGFRFVNMAVLCLTFGLLLCPFVRRTTCSWKKIAKERWDFLPCYLSSAPGKSVDS